MNSYSIVQFSALVIYLILMVVVLRYAKTRLKNLFLIFVFASAAWSLSSFLAHADFSREQAPFWFKLVAFCPMWGLLAYSHFIAAFLRKSARTLVRIGCGYLLVLATLIALGYIPRRIVPLGESNVAPEYGPWLIFFTIFGLYAVGTAVFSLVTSYRASRDPEHRNRVIYLLVGISLMTLFGFAFEAIQTPTYPVDQFGNLGNALVVTYATLRYRLLDVKLVIRKGLAYSGITVCITAAYLIVLYGLQYFMHSWATPIHLGAVIVVAIAMAWLFNPLRTATQRIADRLFYGERYDYREMVLTFARRMSNVLDLGELAEAMLQPIGRAVRAKQVSLLLSDGKDFSPRFAERLVKEEPVIPVKLRKDSPIVTWLAREDKPLFREIIDIKPEFKALWEADWNALNAAEVELLCPIISKHTLIGILVLSKKEPHGFYSTDDVNMLMTLANEAAVVIENAQLYAQARERANTDELTGLFNHRYFHQRLDEEIARCSRFGAIFSLLLLDLDFFKSYNDIYGHLEGDEILRLVSQQIKASSRRIDIGFRYGGDEFAVILPQTPLDGARRLAERIRKSIEAQLDTKSSLTCSLGIGSWPTDGVMREELVRAADAALYHAKQTGKNRTCLASEVALSQVLRMEAGTQDRSAILSTIYALAATVDAKDHYTYGHSKKVSQYATDVAEALGYSEDRVATIRAAALLHDIGKIGISDDVLGKPGPLTAEDWEPIRAHPHLGVSILKHVDALKDCLAAVQYHHERYDGTGYPAGLQGDNIPLDARILAVADAYDAMTSARPYRPKKLTSEEGLEELKRCSGKQFDPTIVDVFVNLTAPPAQTPMKAKKQPVASSGQK